MNLDELNVFNAETLPKETGGADRAAALSVSNKTGVIYFSKNAAKLLNITETSKISFVQSKSEKKDWFICKDDNGFSLKLDPGKSNFRVHHKGLIRNILESMDAKDIERQRFLIAGKPTNVKGDKKVYHALLVL